MNRSEIIAALRAVVETRIIKLPRVVGSAALVLHGVLDSCNDVNLFVTPREWGIITANDVTVPHVHHPDGTITQEFAGHPVTYACVSEYVQMWTTELHTETEGEASVGITACIPPLEYLLNSYEAFQRTSPSERSASIIERLKAKIAA